MDTTPTNQPVQTPLIQTPAPISQPESSSQAPFVGPKKFSLPRAAWIGIAIVGALLVLSTVMTVIKNSDQGNTQDVTPTDLSTSALPTPAPARNLSSIASSSAFMSFTQNVASLSATVNAFTLQDGSFTPPSLDLDIGFSAQ